MTATEYDEFPMDWTSEDEDDEPTASGMGIMDFEDEELDELADDSIRELTPDEVSNLIQAQEALTLASTSETHANREQFTTELGLKLKPGMTVELSGGDFLRILFIIRIPAQGASARSTIFKGILMRRFRKIQDMLPKQLNELCMVLKAPVTKVQRDAPARDCLTSCEEKDIVAIRQVVITNAIFPLQSFRCEGRRADFQEAFYDCSAKKHKLRWKKTKVEEHAKLVCRYRHTEEFDIARGKIVAQSLMRVREVDCDAGKHVEDVNIRLTWTGQTLEGLKQHQAAVEAKAGHDAEVARKREKAAAIPIIDLCDEPEPPSVSPSSKLRMVITIDDSESESDTGWQTYPRKNSKRRKGSNRTGTDDTERYEASSTMCSKEAITPVRDASKRLNRLTLDTSCQGSGSSSSSHSSSGALTPGSSRSSSIYLTSPSKKRKRSVHDDEEEHDDDEVEPQSHTYGDLCCGAGGTAMGALQAGLKIVFGVDNWDPAIRTFDLNFGHGIKKDLNGFCTMRSARLTGGTNHITVLHISFPCQAHSHLNQGQNPERDMENIATGYSVLPLLKKHKPRVVTFEQTPGIMTKRDGIHYRALVNQLTTAGYSLRWRILNLAEYGNAQARKRLIVIASCPGEPVPHFPAPTHGEAYGLRPFTTIHDALKPLTPRVLRTLQPHMHTFTAKDQMSYNRYVPLRGLITTSGGESDLHPSGKRSFTIAELALLQGFSVYHKFAEACKTDLRKQIGNAVPTVFAKQLFESVIKSLEESDRKGAEWDGKVALDE